MKYYGQNLSHMNNVSTLKISSKFKNIGEKAFILAGVLFVWLIAGGYAIVSLFG